MLVVMVRIPVGSSEEGDAERSVFATGRVW